VAVDPHSKFVYVANSGSNSISEFTLNSTTGVLTKVSGSPVNTGAAPAAVSVDPSGVFVFTGNAASDDVSSFRLNSPSGALTALVPGPFRARKSPASLVVSSGSSNITYTPSFAFVADFEGFSGAVPVLSVSATSGALTAIKGSPFGTGTPRAIAASPNGKFVYTAKTVMVPTPSANTR
jgi:6-phosphogluconolactonase